jgi:2,3-diketo-5-methylthio-1-phosphopentane phosphatase
MTNKTTLIVDFDGTITHLDVGDELCDRFADPRWRELDRLWEEKRISLPDAQVEMWAMVRATPDELAAAARELGTVRAGLDPFLDAAAGRELILASGGFDFYIEAILGARLHRFGAVYANHGVPGGGSVVVSFPHRAALGCPLCAVCKGRLCDARRAAGQRVVFVGDGTSDRCAIGRADLLFAVRGSKLAAACDAVGAPYLPFDTFDDVTRAVLA